MKGKERKISSVAAVLIIANLLLPAVSSAGVTTPNSTAGVTPSTSGIITTFAQTGSRADMIFNNNFSVTGGSTAKFTGPGNGAVDIVVVKNGSLPGSVTVSGGSAVTASGTTALFVNLSANGGLTISGGSTINPNIIFSSFTASTSALPSWQSGAQSLKLAGGGGMTISSSGGSTSLASLAPSSLINTSGLSGVINPPANSAFAVKSTAGIPSSMQICYGPCGTTPAAIVSTTTSTTSLRTNSTATNSVPPPATTLPVHSNPVLLPPPAPMTATAWSAASATPAPAPGVPAVQQNAVGGPTAPAYRPDSTPTPAAQPTVTIQPSVQPSSTIQPNIQPSEDSTQSDDQLKLNGSKSNPGGQSAPKKKPNPKPNPTN